MIAAARQWLRRNRTKFAIGFGTLGAGYLVTHYVLGKISEARERLSSDRIARENLRRRFQQNQEDCTFTVLALLPTAAENILDALPVEDITHELQQQRAEKLGRSTATSEISPSEFSSAAPTTADGDGKSASGSAGDSFIHTSQLGQSTLGSDATGALKIKKTKAQLWNELKISSITRSFTLIYTLALLTLLTRIQLNLLGRRSYLSSVVSLASPSSQDPTIISLENHDDDRAEHSYGNDFEVNRKFLTFSWWLLHRGWRHVMEKVEDAVKEAFGPVNPREDVSLERLSQLVVEVRKKIEGATEEERRTKTWLSYLLPPHDRESYVLAESGVLGSSPSSPSPPAEAAPASPSSLHTSIPRGDPLRRLLDETSDLIDSPTATHILTLLLDALFSNLTDNVLRTQAYKLPLPSLDPSARVQELLPALPGDDPQSSIDVETGDVDPASVRAKLATILAVVARQAHAIARDVPNEYVRAIEGVRELEAFAAVVYSSNFEFESARGAGAGEGGEEEDDDDNDHKRAIAPETGAAGVVEGEMAPPPVGEKGEEEEPRRRGVLGATWGLLGSAWGSVVGATGGPAIVG